MKLQRVSLEHLAKLAGVHKATVSRALRNHPTIPASTRDRIHAIALREGYRPNPLVAMYQAQARSNRPTAMQSTLAWLNDYPNPACWRDFPWLSGYLRGARERCEACGFRMEEISVAEIQSSGGKEPGSVSEALRRRGIFGGILPLMLHRQCLLEEWSDCVGYSRIGFVYSHYLDGESEGRTHAGFLVEQSQLSPSKQIPVLFLDRFKEGRPLSFDNWMKTHNPDAILSINPVVRDWVEQCGTSVPDQCGLVNLNVVGDVENWSGIRENHEIIGAAAVDLLIGQLSRNEIGVPRQPRKVLIPGMWHEGGTLRPGSPLATERR